MSDDKIFEKTVSITSICLVVYPLMAFLGIGLCFYYNYELFAAQGFAKFYIFGTIPVLSQIIMGLVVTFVTIVLCIWGSSSLAWLKNTEVELKKVIGDLTLREMVIIGVCSGIGEEVLFRGALQPMFGLVWTSLFFGMLHFPVNKQFLFYPIFATIMGFILGYLTIINHGCITSAIVAHAFVNMVNLYRINKVVVEDTPVGD
ncbi:CPBP family intramembrane glutamic endopeptidase [Candidatus Uabimicrobium amorphum]|uniref:Abortive infection protein n=1 Tax=Uabimicrobium amorphum TaxID=2596890 RepID=A0A5S9F304_UABAM|nr:CPBP family intramembrane glutamic endopeptidase [Candidatus Uabimicrobium amorphum]BBM83643.1 abortive infection protein [Candidatus Uabimicrobium amorphum]